MGVLPEIAHALKDACLKSFACEPGLDHVLALAEPTGPSRLPLR